MYCAIKIVLLQHKTFSHKYFKAMFLLIIYLIRKFFPDYTNQHTSEFCLENYCYTTLYYQIKNRLTMSYIIVECLV